MKCPKCGNSISELDEKCSKCGLVFDEYEESKETEENEDNSKTLLLKIINAIQLIGCIIIAIVFLSNEQTLIGIIFFFSGIVLYAFIKGFTNIIDLLDSINNKLN